jgi:hypothetical protein
MARQTIYEAYAYATGQNTAYTRNRDRWQFLLESYMGGETYREGAHLTRYVLETQEEYRARLRNTPLDNHCRSVISVYVSFLFRQTPQRDLGSIQNTPGVEDFLRDADFDGRSIDSFMKEVSIWSSVFGHAWILMTKPAVPADSLADQLAQGVRPYVNLLTPLTVVDWRWTRDINGQYRVTYFKYIEDVNNTVTTIREWTEDSITTWIVDENKREAQPEVTELNQLGRIPVVLVYNHRSQVRGFGLSDIDDIADQQRAIYNELSEVEQSIRMDGHPSLVKTPDTQIGAGAGAIIEMPENLDPGLKPYMLNADGTPVDMIYKSIQNRVNAIDRMANTGAVRAVETREISGIAMQTEFQLLNAKLAEKAANLELAEEQMWRLWCLYQGVTWDGTITYPASFNITDVGAEFNQLSVARSTATNPAVTEVIDRRLLQLLDADPDALMSDSTETPAPVTRTYENGEPIAEDLPAGYRNATGESQQCENCAFYLSETFQCSRWNNAAVRPMWVCAVWQPQG